MQKSDILSCRNSKMGEIGAFAIIYYIKERACARIAKNEIENKRTDYRSKERYGVKRTISESEKSISERKSSIERRRIRR